MLTAFTGQPIEMTGKEERPFEVKLALGKEDPAELLRAALAQAAMGIETANLAGIEMKVVSVGVSAEEGRIAADLQGGLLEGTMNLPLRVDAAAETPVLTIPPETQFLNAVRINDALADKVLARLSPIFARAINTEGLVDITVRTLNAPLDLTALDQARASVTLNLSGVGFTSAGFLREILDAVGQGESAFLTLPDQQIQVELRDGLIRQSPMAITFGDYAMTLSGDMALNGTLNMVAELPVTRAMVRDKNIYEALKGETLRVPVRGTVTRPKVARNIIKENLNTLIRAASRKLLEKEGSKLIERGLKDLFD